MSHVARLLRGLLPVLAAAATAAATGLPAAAAAGVASPAAAVAGPGQVARSGEWWLSALHVLAAQQAAHALGAVAGRGVTVAVLSTGVDASHPDLSGRVITGPDLGATGRTRGGAYWGAEGTAVASLIAGHGHGPGGSAGITGIAPGARILSVPVTLEYDDPQNVDAAVTRRLPAAIAAGIRYAVNHGAGVIALPLDPGALGAAPPGDPAADGSAAEQSAVRYAVAHNVVLVAPAGDDGAAGNAVDYPAAYPGVITVGATSRNGQLAPFTSRHSYVALTAPGSGDTPETAEISTSAGSPAGLTVADPDGAYQSLASSDMSAALTAGVAALIRSRYPRLTAADVGQALERGAVAVAVGGSSASGNGAGNTAAGWGRGKLNAARTVAAAAATATAQPAPSASRPTATGPSTSPSPVTSATPVPRAGRQPAPGRLLRSLVVGLTIAAAALIITLVIVVTLARTRRRRARMATMASGAAPRGGGHRGRHARDPRSGPPPMPRPATGAPFPPAPPPPATAVSLVPDIPVPRAVRWPDDPPHRLLPDEKPPWPPAREPGRRVSPDAFLSAAPESARAAGFPQIPDLPQVPDYARASWPVSTTGPMYVWNPNATTGPQEALQPEAGDSGAASEEPGPAAAPTSPAARPDTATGPAEADSRD